MFLLEISTTIFTSMILLLAYKVMYESRSIINGHWPFITCSSKNSEGFMSRIPYTWFGVLIGSFLFYFLCLYLLSVSSKNNFMILGRLCNSASCNHSLTYISSFSIIFASVDRTSIWSFGWYILCDGCCATACFGHIKYELHPNVFYPDCWYGF
jgi:hypothetical protein